MTPWTFPVLAARAVDGDTVEVTLDLGFGVRIEETFRLLGIDAPELRTPSGPRAKAWLQRQLSAAKSVELTSHRNSKNNAMSDKYGRYLATFLVDGADLCARSLRLGYSVPWDGHGQHPTQPTIGVKP